MIRKLSLFIGAAFIVLQAHSQEQEKSEFSSSLGVDLASSYLWRGISQGSTPAFQPNGEFSFKGFTAGVWGSYEFSGDFNEIDINAKYTLKAFSLQFMDMFFPGDPVLSQDYFNFRNSGTGHGAEVGLSFDGTESFPLNVFAGTIIYGSTVDPSVDDSTRLNHSVYIEIGYPVSRKNVDCNLFAGLTPFSSVLYETDKFALINLGLSARKIIQVTERFSVPFELTLAANPASNQFHMAAILSF